MATIIKLVPTIQLTDEQFFEFCQVNPMHQFERTAEGELVIMSPTGSESGQRNFNLIAQFGVWVQRDGTGVGFDSSTGFTLPNGAVRSPDVAWVKRARWDALSSAQRKRFAPLCPDFVMELRSESDDLALLQAKMQEYLDNGTSLGWLIDPIEQQVSVYRPDQTIQVLNHPATLSGESVLPGFVLDLSQIW